MPLTVIVVRSSNPTTFRLNLFTGMWSGLMMPFMNVSLFGGWVGARPDDCSDLDVDGRRSKRCGQTRAARWCSGHVQVNDVAVLHVEAQRVRPASYVGQRDLDLGGVSGRVVDGERGDHDRIDTDLNDRVARGTADIDARR